MTKKETVEKAVSLFNEGYACSQAVLLAFADRFDLDEKTAKRLSSTFGAGMGRLREKCGALSGSFMVLGLAYGNDDPKDNVKKLSSYKKVRDLNQKFKDFYHTTSCAEIIQQHATPRQVEERMHHALICHQVVEDAAGMLYDILEG